MVHPITGTLSQEVPPALAMAGNVTIQEIVLIASPGSPPQVAVIVPGIAKLHPKAEYPNCSVLFPTKNRGLYFLCFECQLYKSRLNLYNKESKAKNTMEFLRESAHMGKRKGYFIPV